MTIQSISYVTTTTFELIANRINGAKRIVVTTHRKPDGDAIGSVVGMYRALRSIDKEVEVLIAGPLEHGLAIIAGDTPLRFIEDDGFPEEVPDLIIVGKFNVRPRCSPCSTIPETEIDLPRTMWASSTRPLFIRVRTSELLARWTDWS